MSFQINPYGQFDSLRSAEYLRVAPVAKSEAPTAQGQSAQPHKSAAEFGSASDELAFAAAARGNLVQSGAVGMPKSRSVVQGRPLSQLYRLGRLRGLHALVQDSFMSEETPAGAQELVLSALHDEAGDLERRAEALAPDAFRRYVCLLEADLQLERAAAAAGASEVEIRRARQALEQVLDVVWAAHQAEVAAGFNTAQPLSHFARNLAEWDEFRRIYYSWVALDGPLAATFKSLLEKFGPERLPQAIRNLRAAMVADLASPIVCSDRTRMVQQQTDLEQNRAISSLMADSEDFLRRFGPAPPAAQQIVNFVGGLLDYAAGPSNERKLNALCAIATAADDVNENVRRPVREFMKQKLPLPLWASVEGRETLFPPALRIRSGG